MSKSRGNVINPDDVVMEFGADSFRLYEMFMGPLDKAKPWNTKGLQGCHRFILKTWKLYIKHKDISKNIKNNDTKTETLFHQTIKKITDDLNKLQFNTAISQLMILTNHLAKQKSVSRKLLENMLILLNPFAPHITEELNHLYGNSIVITKQKWPKWDSEKIKEETIDIPVQINGKLKANISVNIENDSKEEIINKAKNSEKILIILKGKQIIKEIYVPGRIINIVIK
jgi:leucyl-tRNA synthetase